MKVWNAQTGQEILSVKEGYASVVFSPDGNFVLTSGPNADARLWESGKVVRTLRESVGARGVASFSPDGRWIVTAGTVSAGLWDASSAAPLLFLRGHSGRITGALFAGAGRVVTAGLDGTIRAYRCLVCGPTNELIALAKAREARIARGG